MNTVPISIATEFVLNGLAKLAEASARIRAARAEGRDHLNPMEGNDQARSDAQASVDLASAEGR